MIKKSTLDRWLKLFLPITPLVLPSTWLRACACAAMKMYLSLSHTHSFLEIPDIGYVVLVLDEIFVKEYWSRK